MPIAEEELAAEILYRTVLERTNSRRVIDRFFSRHRELDYMRPIVKALSLRVARNYILLDHALARLGYTSPSHSRRWMLARVLAYEALIGKLKKSRAKKLASKAGLELSDLEVLSETSIRDIVAGLSGLKRLSVLYSMPLWLLAEIARLGPPQLEKLLKTLNEDPVRWARIAPWASSLDVARRLGELGVVIELEDDLPGLARVVVKASSLQEATSISNWELVFQDKASMLVSFLASSSSRSVIDVTAGPGGKIGYAGWLGVGYAVGGDLKESRARLVLEHAEKTGVGHAVDVYQGDARFPPIRLESFDAIIVDPPCSDLGRLQYEPEIKMWLTRGDVSLYSRIQYQVLKRISERAKREARIVYSVCTITWRETVGVLKRVLRENPYLVPVEPEKRIGVRVKQLPEAQLLLPHIHGTQGFFIAVLEKK